MAGRRRRRLVVPEEVLVDSWHWRLWACSSGRTRRTDGSGRTVNTLSAALADGALRSGRRTRVASNPRRAANACCTDNAARSSGSCSTARACGARGASIAGHALLATSTTAAGPRGAGHAGNAEHADVATGTRGTGGAAAALSTGGPCNTTGTGQTRVADGTRGSGCSRRDRVLFVADALDLLRFEQVIDHRRGRLRQPPHPRVLRRVTSNRRFAAHVFRIA